MKLNKEEMTKVDGGGITSAMLNAITKAVNTVYQLGRQTGSALKRILQKAHCPLN